MKARTLLWILVMAATALTARAGNQATGENAVLPNGEPSKAGQPTADHLFVRGNYMGETYDNIVAFDEGNTKLVWIWLDDDAIYRNTRVQGLTPIPYNRTGDLYNEITYNSFQCDIYVPEHVSLVDVENEDGDVISFERGDRMPNSTTVQFQQNATKVIDGMTYRRYTVLCTNIDAYGCHFSSRTPALYQANGALKKDDAALFGLYVQYDGTVPAGELPNMIIANVEFGFREAFTNTPVWEPNDYRFFYGSGGNNKKQRFQYYHRVRLFGDNGFVPTATPVISYRISNDAVTITADGDGEVTLMIDGSQVSNPCSITRGDVDQTVLATATAREQGKDVSNPASMTIVVPAKPSTDVQEGNRLSLPPVMNVQSGVEFTLPVAMTNTVDVTALQCDLVLPEGFELGMKDGAYWIDLVDERTGDSHTVSARMLADGSLRLLIASPVAEPFKGKQGDLFVLHVKSSSAVADGTYPLRLENIILADANAATYYAPDILCNILVKTYLRGDANGDGAVNVGDYVTTANYILAMEPDPFIFTAADIDQSNTVDVGDLVGIVSIIMGGEVASVSLHDDSFRYVMLDYDIKNENGTRYVTLQMENKVPLTAFQMNLLMHQGVTLKGAQLSSRAAHHSLIVNDMGDGNVKLLSASATNEEVLGSKGDLLTLAFDCEPQKDLWVEINNVLMAEPDMTTHELPFYLIFDGTDLPISVNELSSDVRIGGKDGMVIVETPADTTVDLMLTNGMNRTVTARAGVNTYPVGHGICIVRAAGQVAKLKL